MVEILREYMEKKIKSQLEAVVFRGHKSYRWFSENKCMQRKIETAIVSEFIQGQQGSSPRFPTKSLIPKPSGQLDLVDDIPCPRCHVGIW